MLTGSSSLGSPSLVRPKKYKCVIRMLTDTTERELGHGFRNAK